MKTTFSLNETMALDPCAPGFDAVDRIGRRMYGDAWSRDTQFDFDLALEYVKEATLSHTWIANHKAQLLNYTDKQFQCYVFNGQTYAELQDAQTAQTAFNAERRAYHLALTVCNFYVVYGEDHTWHSIPDVDSFEQPSNGHECMFQVFNHKTGVYLPATTVQEMKDLRDLLVQQFVDEEALKVYTRYLYAEDGVTTVDEAV